MSGLNLVNKFTAFAASEFGDNAKAVVLTGSYAKNDFTEKSDIDLWLILGSLTINELKLTGNFCNGINASKLNVQCVTAAELLTKPFKKAFSPVQIYIDGIVKHGKLPAYYPYNSEVRNYAASIAAEVIMSSRHYITASESEGSLASGRLLKWVLKPLSWVYRYKAFLRNSNYPRSFDELKNTFESSEDIEFINDYESVLENKYKGSFIELNNKSHSLAIKNSTI